MIDHQDSLIVTKLREALLEELLEVGRKGARRLSLSQAVTVNVKACGLSTLKIDLERSANDALVQALI
ncbi:MAG: hypothetical protein ACKOI2_12460 [Actinomycetota bacterium]